MRGLKPNNELLETLRKAFLQMLEDEHFSIHSFFETKPMVGVYGVNGLVRLSLHSLSTCRIVDRAGDIDFTSQVVPYESALVGHARKEICLGICGNHREMCKFANEDDQGYKAVQGALQDYVEAARKQMRAKMSGVSDGEPRVVSSGMEDTDTSAAAETAGRESGEYYSADEA